MEQQNPIQDPSQEMDSPIFDQLQADMAAKEVADRAAAEQQAIVDAAHAEALESGRLSAAERELYRGIARAAGTAELPEGTSDEARRSTIPFRSTPAKAEAALQSLRADARDKLRADRADRNQERHDRKAREAQEEADRIAAETEAKRVEDERRQAEEAARQAKLDVERDRVRSEVKQSKVTAPEEVDAEVERMIAEKHSHLSEQSKGMMRTGLRAQVEKAAAESIEEAANKAGDERVAYINANGGADAIESIRAEEARQAAEAAREADKQAFQDRLHNKNATANSPIAANARAEAEATPEAQASLYLSAEDRARLQAIVRASDASQLPDGLSREDRRAVNHLVSTPAKAAQAFAELRARAQEQLNTDSDARDALVSRVRAEGIDGLTDEEIGLLPTTAMGEMSDEARGAYFARLHQVMGENRGEREEHNLRGLHSEIINKAQTPEGDTELPFNVTDLSSESNTDPDERERRFADLFALEDADRDEWRHQLGLLSDEDRQAYFDYGLNRMRNEATNPVGTPPVSPDRQVWPPQAPDVTGGHDGYTRRAPEIPRFPRPRRRAFGGAMDPAMPMPDNAGIGRVDSGLGDAPERPLTPQEQADQARAALPWYTRTWDTAKRWWPGKSRVSYRNDRPNATRATFRVMGNGISAGWNAMFPPEPELPSAEEGQSQTPVTPEPQPERTPDGRSVQASPETPRPRTTGGVPRPQRPSRGTGPRPGSQIDNL